MKNKTLLNGSIGGIRKLKMKTETICRTCAKDSGTHLISINSYAVNNSTGFMENNVKTEQGFQETQIISLLNELNEKCFVS